MTQVQHKYHNIAHLQQQCHN